jgi:cytochrome P450
MARLESRVKALVQQAVAELPMGQPVDLVPSFGLRIPASVIGDMMGLDPALHTRLKRWADMITGGVTTVRPEEEDRKQLARDAVAELRRYSSELLDRRRQELGDDMVSDLLRARVDGVALTQDELIAFFALLMVGGIETTMHLLGSSIVVLLERPELMARLKADRSLIPAFIEEVLRYEPPIQCMPRSTTEEVELGGVRLPKGTPVLAVLGSACHDETHFPDGDSFNMDRPGLQNLPFGYGIHFCLGSQLARLEGRLALDAFLNRVGRMERGPEPMTWHRTLVQRGPGSLPVVLHPA